MLNVNNCCHFNIYEQDKFHLVQLVWAWKKFYNLETCPRGYKTFFMHNSAEHEIYSDHKC